MRKGIGKKLHSRRGETLTETLAAILVIGLVSGGLAAMISAATHMNQEAERMNSELYEAIQAAERKTDVISGTVKSTLTITVDGTQSTVDVAHYGKEPVFSYGHKGGS